MQYIQEVGKEIPFDTSIEPQDKENKDNTKQVDTSMKKKQLKIWHFSKWKETRKTSVL